MKLIFKIAVIFIVFISCEEPTEIVRHAPVIKSINFSRSTIYPNEFVDVTANATDEDEGDKLTYNWQTSCGHFNNTSNNPTQWFAPDHPDTCTITLTVSDGYFEVSDSAEIIVVKKGDVVLKMESQEVQTEYQNALDELEIARAELQKREAELTLERLELESQIKNGETD